MVDLKSSGDLTMSCMLLTFFIDPLFLQKLSLMFDFDIFEALRRKQLNFITVDTMELIRKVQGDKLIMGH